MATVHMSRTQTIGRFSSRAFAPLGAGPARARTAAPLLQLAPARCPAVAPAAAPRRARAVRVEAAKKAAVAAAATSAFPGLQSAVGPLVPAALAAATACLGAVALLMALLPNAAITRRVARSNVPYAVLAVAYGVVLAASWQADTLALMMPGSWAEGFKGGFNPQFFPSLDSVGTLFTRSFTSASFLLHVVFINLFAARTIYNHGFDSRVPTAHSVLLAALVGPLGVLSHFITQLFYSVASKAAGRDLRPRPGKIEAPSGDGIITIYGYEN